MATRTYTTRDHDPEAGPIGAAEPRRGAISIRTLALGGALAGGIGIAGAIADAVAIASTDVSEDIWSYPWSGATFVATTLLFAVLHALCFGLLLGLRRSGLTGPTRGVGVAMAGTVVVFLAEFASIPARDFDVESTTVTAVIIPMFALGGLLAAVGLIVAGRATLRARRWDGWGRFTPLGLGIAALLPTLLGPTDLFPYGFAIYGAALLALGAALASARLSSVSIPLNQSARQVK